MRDGPSIPAGIAASDEQARMHATAPRVSAALIQMAILRADYFTAGAAAACTADHGLLFTELGEDADPHNLPEALDRLTLCVVTLRNGYTVVGKSAPASPDNFDVEKGRAFAMDDAMRQLWPLMGYALRVGLHRQATA